MATDRETLKAELSTMDFPASKEQLVDYVERNRAQQSTIRALRALPLADYESLSEVIGAVPLDKAAEEGQSDREKAKEQRHNTKDALAEQNTDIPSNPIVEELGENRGS